MNSFTVASSDDVISLLDTRTAAILAHRRRHGIVRRRGWLVRRALVVADVIGLTIGFVLAEYFFPGLPQGDRITMLNEVILFGCTLPLWVVGGAVAGIYDKDEERADYAAVDDFAAVFQIVTVGAWLLYAVLYLTRWGDPNFPKLFTFWLLASILVPTARSIGRSWCRRQIDYLQNTLIIGAGTVGQSIAHKLLRHREYGLNLVGFVDDQPRERDAGLGHLTILGGLDQVERLVGLLDIERVIIAFSYEYDSDLLDLSRELNELGVQVDVVPRLYEVVGPGADIHTVGGIALVGLPPVRLARSSRFLKRSLDAIGATLGLLLLAPVFLAIAVAIKRDSRGPIFFRQLRVGRGDRLFHILKFRTMVEDADDRKGEFAHLNKHLADDPRMFKIDHDPRVTRVGAFLRRFSIDELPQLINVLRGEMSLVGPRPLILDEHRHVNAWARRRLDLRPGMTGLWQVLGRDDIGFDEMVKLDYLYVTSWSLWSDARLLSRTLPIVFKGHDEPA